MTITSAIKILPVRAKDKKYNTEVVKMINAAFQSSESWSSGSAIVNVDRISIERLDEMIRIHGTENILLFGFDGETVVGSININKHDGVLSMLAISP
ncbi:hypothetical protein BD770DRAFT_380351 [Pilaira anomala]|nr:hypothetical protein BD770DRAFT_380351 [Pilaira anomala]